MMGYTMDRIHLVTVAYDLLHHQYTMLRGTGTKRRCVIRLHDAHSAVEPDIAHAPRSLGDLQKAHDAHGAQNQIGMLTAKSDRHGEVIAIRTFTPRDKYAQARGGAAAWRRRRGGVRVAGVRVDVVELLGA